MCSPLPYPLPCSHPRHDFWGLFQCQGCGRVGAKGGFGIGNRLPPSYPPSPDNFFFRGVPWEKGDRTGPYDALILPAPFPTSPVRSWRNWIPGVESGTNAHPTAHNLTLTTSINAPAPTRSKLGSGLGGGLGVDSSINPTLPQQGAPPPVGCEGGRSARSLLGGG